MITEQYQAFKSWLIATNRAPCQLSELKIISASDFVDMLFSANKIIERYISENDDLFTLIQAKDYENIYRFRMHFRNKITPKQNVFLQFCFEYHISWYGKYEEFEADKILSKISKANTLFLYKSKIICLKHKHPIEDVRASVIIGDNRQISIHANRCAKCGIIFMHYSEYERLKKTYPFLIANFCELSSDGYTPVVNKSIASESMLMLCGYNVKNGVLSERQRHLLLRNIIYNDILSKAEIIDYLEHFITFNGSKKNMFFAVSKWENDLSFVRQLDIESHPEVFVNEIKQYHHNDNYKGEI